MGDGAKYAKLCLEICEFHHEGMSESFRSFRTCDRFCFERLRWFNCKTVLKSMGSFEIIIGRPDDVRRTSRLAIAFAWPIILARYGALEAVGGEGILQMIYNLLSVFESECCFLAFVKIPFSSCHSYRICRFVLLHLLLFVWKTNGGYW